MYLDPHTTQPMVHPQDLNHIPDTSYHCHSPGYMKISDIDPSIALVTSTCQPSCINIVCRASFVATKRNYMSYAAL